MIITYRTRSMTGIAAISIASYGYFVAGAAPPGAGFSIVWCD